MKKSEDTVTPLGAVARGVLAGVAGTAAMTAWQELSARLQGDGKSDGGDSSAADRDPWESAPAPAKVAKRVLEGVFRKPVGPNRIELLTNVTHWGYGTAWGAVYGLVQGTVRANPVAHGLTFGAGVWAMSYVQLVPTGLYEPPWKYPPKTLALDASYHLVYGLGVGIAHAALGAGRS